jgi:tetratricopeptide (TPR) repeat protein
VDRAPRKSSGGRTRHDAIFVATCLVAACGVLAAYSNHFDNGFHFDDSHVIVDNLSIRGLHDVPRFFADPQTFTSLPQNAVYRPLLTLSYAIDYHLGGGLEPRQFHLTQFGLLLLLGVLLVPFIRRLFDSVDPGPRNRWVALAAATLFCIHTANTETVNYLSSRSSLVATLSVVAAFLVYMAWPCGRRLHLYLLPMLIGGLAKPLTVMFAPLLFVFVYLFEQRCSFGDLARREGWHALRKSLARSAPALVAGVALFFFLRAMDAPTLQYATIDRWDYARTQPFVWLHYFRLFLFPRGLTADTDWGLVERWLDARLLIGGLFLVALCAAVVWLTRRPGWRPIAFGLAWFAIALAPTSSIVPLSEVYNEHRIFFPYVGLTAAAAWAIALGLGKLGRPRVAAAVGALLAVALVAAHGVGTHRRNLVWRDEKSLWKDVTVKSPRNGRGLMNYGLVLMGEGEMEKALTYYERAARINRNYPVLEINLGIVKSALGDPTTAEPHFRRALQLQPDYAQGHFYYARWLVEHGRAPEAIAHLERAVAISPGDVHPNRMLLDAFAALDDAASLAAHARRVLKIAPSDPAATAYLAGRVPYEVAEESAGAYAELGLAKIHHRRWLESAALYRHALRLDPNDAASWNNLGWALGSAGFHALAVACFERALELDPASEHARENLRWARERHSAAGPSP